MNLLQISRIWAKIGVSSEGGGGGGGGELITPKPNMPFMEGLGISSVCQSLSLRIYSA